MSRELVGWKEIADRLGVTVRAAQRYAAFERDPLPCYRRLRSVRLDEVQLDAWLDRHREPLGDVDAASVVLVASDPRLAHLMRLFHRAALHVLQRADSRRDERVAEVRQVTLEEYVAQRQTPAAGVTPGTDAVRARRGRVG